MPKPAHLFLAGLTLAGGLLAVASPAQASPPTCTAPGGWVTKIDQSGPNRAGRATATCRGREVHVVVRCANGKSYHSAPYWKATTNVALCPAGVKATSLTPSVRTG
ncbi:hypothetical protein [Longispora albida]|uniref:hypothetical protein n=1 Tax=Longispora albida TaxID=203523 RepID=UPI00037EDDD3|nr:hypothetical protein [Longispora albida]